MKRIHLVVLIAILFLAGCGPSTGQLKQKGISEFQLGRNDRAKELLQQVLHERPFDAQALYYMGRVMHAERFHSMAIYYYQCAIDADPSHTEARRWLARATSEAGQPGQILRFIPTPPAKRNS